MFCSGNRPRGDKSCWKVLSECDCHSFTSTTIINLSFPFPRYCACVRACVCVCMRARVCVWCVLLFPPQLVVNWNYSVLFWVDYNAKPRPLDLVPVAESLLDTRTANTDFPNGTTLRQRQRANLFRKMASMFLVWQCFMLLSSSQQMEPQYLRPQYTTSGKVEERIKTHSSQVLFISFKGKLRCHT